MTVEITSHLGCLISNVALGKEGKSYQAKQEMFLRKNGIEWTCNRSKAIWNIALLLRNGDTEEAIKLCQANSISYHKPNGTPKGIEGRVVTRFCQAQRPTVIKRISAALRFYTSLKLSEPSEKQVNKALKSITDPYEGTVLYSGLRSLGAQSCKETLNERNIKVYSLDEKPLSFQERDASNLKFTSSYYSPVKVPQSLKKIIGTSFAMSLMTVPFVPYQIDKLTPNWELREFLRQEQRKKGLFANDHMDYSSKITILQEQGCKARVVCQPSSWSQLAFMPLNNRLFNIIKSLFPKESCVHKQENGVYAMMEQLRRDEPIYSIDLSSATDRFPRDFSLGILDQLGYGCYSDALEEFCKFPVDGSQLGVKTVRYTVGQPMGLYGSFPLFHLSNLVVADMCTRKSLKRFKNLTSFFDKTYFKVLGDDIIISDQVIADTYRQTMKDFGVQISEHKSFDGNLAEFAGFIAVKTNKSITAYRPYKIPEGDTISNGISFLDSLGIKVKSLSNWWSKQYEMYRRTTGDRDITLAPLITNDSFQFNRPSNRIDNHTVKNLVNIIKMTIDSKYLPDLERNSFAINEIPLFQERRMFDFYGYNPETYTKPKKEFVPYSESTGIKQDPLMKREKVRIKSISDRLKEPQPTIKMDSSSFDYDDWDHS